MARIPPNEVGKQRTKLTGRLGISRPSGQTDYINITIEDAASGVQFVDLELSLEDFAYAITGLRGVTCKFEARGLDLIGKEAEYKTERVLVRTTEWDERPAVAFDAAKSLETDGWQYCGPRRDAGRNASWSQGDWQAYDNPMGAGPRLTNHWVNLKFVRWVAPSIDAKTIPEYPQPIRKRVRRPDNL